MIIADRKIADHARAGAGGGRTVALRPAGGRTMRARVNARDLGIAMPQEHDALFVHYVSIVRTKIFYADRFGGGPDPLRGSSRMSQPADRP